MEDIKEQIRNLNISERLKKLPIMLESLVSIFDKVSVIMMLIVIFIIISTLLIYANFPEVWDKIIVSLLYNKPKAIIDLLQDTQIITEEQMIKSIKELLPDEEDIPKIEESTIWYKNKYVISGGLGILITFVLIFKIMKQ